MSDPFRSFVIFAEMRTGSNLLEATLNRVRGVTCHGEAFNPYMMGWPGKDELQGITSEERDADPMVLLRRLLDRPGHLPGFRYFHDHDPRVFDAIMDDHYCAKIILSRNPLDSYVSAQLAWKTNQWKLNQTEVTEVPDDTAIAYDGQEFRQTLAAIDGFQQRLVHRLQASGQSAFWLSYENLRDVQVMTGLLHWLGRTDLERVAPANDQVPQNPRQMAAKVVNFDEMQADLRTLDPFGLQRTPSFEPRRGPAVPSFLASEGGAGLLYMPVRGGPVDLLADWLRILGQVSGNFTQNSLRRWKRDHPGYRSFTVLRHPLHRGWDAFMQLLVGASPELRQLLRDMHRVALPPDEDIPAMSEEDSAGLFLDFLAFLRRNLNGQTSLPTQPDWASQSEVIAGFSSFSQPDMLVREDRMTEDLAYLCHTVGIEDMQAERLARDAYPDFLMQPDMQKAARAAYQRDYVAFGYSDQP